MAGWIAHWECLITVALTTNALSNESYLFILDSLATHSLFLGHNELPQHCFFMAREILLIYLFNISRRATTKASVPR